MSGDENAPVNDEPASPTDDAENGSAIQDDTSSEELERQALDILERYHRRLPLQQRERSMHLLQPWFRYVEDTQRFRRRRTMPRTWNANDINDNTRYL